MIKSSGIISISLPNLLPKRKLLSIFFSPMFKYGGKHENGGLNINLTMINKINMRGVEYFSV
jgi:hypothetical protein